MSIACNSDKNVSDNMEFTNPILSGFYPDPSICRADGMFYLVTSTFAYFPGIPIHKSTDLVNWELAGYAMHRPEQMDAGGLGVSRGIFAPAIRYHDGLFYVTCTLVDKGGNFVVTARSPEGPWSDPVWIPQIHGIDPSLFFDDDGRAFIIYNSIPPDDQPLYQGHRTIRMYEFDIVNLKVTGEEQLLINGGVDINKKPVWIEAPHIFKIDGKYILIAAEGGTADQHSEVVFRSQNVTGPYIPYENNPILTQRDLDPTRKHAITSTGHADLVQTDNGDWWAVFLGCRPYEPVAENYYNTGRETFLAPVKWTGGWPVINPDFKEVQYRYPYPVKPLSKPGKIPFSGNFTYRDEFDDAQLNLNWQFLRTPLEKWYDLSVRKGSLAMQLRPGTCADSLNPGFIGHRQQHLRGYGSLAMAFTTAKENEKAGLLVFQNEKHFYLLCKSADDGKPVIQLFKSGGRTNPENHLNLMAQQSLGSGDHNNWLYLKAEADNGNYAFYFAEEPDIWHLLQEKVDGKFVSTRVAGGFVGCMYALYCTSSGQPSENQVFFDWFETSSNDEVYNTSGH